MSKVISCITAMLLYFTASAAYAVEPCYTVDEIREQITSPWQAIYETQWRTIEVDVLPTVPDVQTMPVLMVRPAFWIPTTDADVEWSLQDAKREPGDAFSLYQGDIWEEENIAKRGKRTDSISYYLYAPLDYGEAYAPGNTLTINEMIEILKNILDDVGVDHFGIDTENLLNCRVGGYVLKGTKEYVLPALLDIDINTTIHDIPIFGHVIMSVDNHKDEELFYEPIFLFTVRSSTSYQLIGRTVRETSELAADVPLCSFDDVRAALEKEIEDGHIRAIYSIDLGYALYNVENASRKPGWEWMQTAEFYAAPTWRCVCLYSKQEKKDLSNGVYDDPYPSLYYKTLYVNAQTGELVDPTDNRKGCGDYPGIITWEAIK